MGLGFPLGFGLAGDLRFEAAEAFFEVGDRAGGRVDGLRRRCGYERSEPVERGRERRGFLGGFHELKQGGEVALPELEYEIVGSQHAVQHGGREHFEFVGVALGEYLSEDLTSEVFTGSTVGDFDGAAVEDELFHLLEGDVSAVGAVVETSVGVASDAKCGVVEGHEWRPNQVGVRGDDASCVQMHH